LGREEGAMLKRLFGLRERSSVGRTGGAYSVREADAVRPLHDIPQSSVGAPLPCIVACEHFLAVAFICQQNDPTWDGSYVQVVSAQLEVEQICVVHFHRSIAHFFGPPNDEAFQGHPLAARGLGPYGSFEVTSSSWIHALERMNAVHPYHKPEHFAGYKHYVLSFHDTTFECVAQSYAFRMHTGSLQVVVGSLCSSL
jgi:hypothetical protein